MSEEDKKEKRAPIKLLISGIILFVGGMIANTLLFIFLSLPLLTPSISNSNIQFLIPGAIEIEIKDEGRYYLRHDYQTLYEKKVYSKLKEVPDNLMISLKTKDGALHYDIIEKKTIITHSARTSSKSIGYFDITVPGDYILEVKGESEPRVFSIRKSQFELGMKMGIGGAVCSLIMLAGFALGVVGIVKIIKARRC